MSDTRRLSDKLDEFRKEISARLGAMTVELAVYNEQLKTHIKRSEMLEQEQKSLEKRIEPLEKEFSFKSKAWNIIYKSIFLAGAGAGLVYTLHRLALI